MTLPPPSSAAMPDDNKIKDAPLMIVGRALAERGHYGFVWVDEELSVTARYGQLVEFVDIGEHLSHSIPAFAGLEADVSALKSNDRAVLEMPAISIVTNTSATPRLNLTVMWLSELGNYLCLATRTGIGSDIEIELAKEIRRRLMAEAEVNAKSRDLTRANQDLEQYASIISHDLQAPMRALRYQIDELEQAAGTDLAPQLAGQLDTLRRQTKRMTSMLTALLDYSSIGKKYQALTEVATRDLVDAVVMSLNPTPKQRIDITGEWPVLTTLEQPLDLVLRNLIDNAIKHAAKDNVFVDVNGRSGGEHFEIRISDNGPGIAPEHREAIFLPFRTLTPNDEDAARGLGLAIVHRIVSGAGGQISLENRADGQTGAVFKVLWPKTLRDI